MTRPIYEGKARKGGMNEDPSAGLTRPAPPQAYAPPHGRCRMTAPDKIWIAPTDGRNGIDDYYLLNPKFRGDRGAQFVRADIVQELVEALEAMLSRHELYCGGPDLPFAGHTDAKLFDMARAALAKLKESGRANAAR